MSFKSFLSENTKVKAAGFVIYSNGKYLIGHVAERPFTANMWGIPKGLVDKGETSLQAGIREVVEECGLKLKSLNGEVAKLGVAKYKPFNGVQKELEGFLFVADDDLTKKKLVCSSMAERDGKRFAEVDKFSWVSLDENNVHYTTKDLAQKAKKLIENGRLKSDIKRISI